MFGTSKNTKTPTNILHERLTGLERAKLDRTIEPRGPTVDEVLRSDPAGEAPVEIKPQKRGVQMTEKPRAEPESAAHLYIGGGIRLKGEIANCDMMRVEGVFEGTAQSRKLVLCAGGAFLGTALIEEAEIEGTFDGNLHVRGRLFLRNKGLIKGQFSYGQLEIERGGQIDGQIAPFEKPRTEAPKPGEAAKAQPATVIAKPVTASAPTLAKVAVAPPLRPAGAVASGPNPLNGAQPPLNGSHPPAAASVPAQ